MGTRVTVRSKQGKADGGAILRYPRAMIAPLIALTLAASGGPADRPVPVVAAAAQHRPRRMRLPERITLKSMPVLRIRTLPNVSSTK
jgi:hypothetical protein